MGNRTVKRRKWIDPRIERVFPSGMWRAYTLVHGYFESILSDDLEGAKEWLEEADRRNAEAEA